MAAGTASGTHLFVSPAGAVLDRWAQAFPSARGVRPRDAVAAVAEGGVQALWLRVQDDPFEPARLLAAALPLPVIVLSDRPLEEEALEAFTGGARGYCNTHAQPVLLHRVWSVVVAGGLWIGEPLKLRLVRATAQAAPHPRWQSELQALNGAERQVLEAVAGRAPVHQEHRLAAGKPSH